MTGRRHKFALLCLIALLIGGCGSALMQKLPAAEYQEQLYINAELNFTVNHPLSWKQERTPVSQPDFRKDTVRWQIDNPLQQGEDGLQGQMLIRSLPAAAGPLTRQLNRFLTERPELVSSRTEKLDHKIGPAIQLLGRDLDNGRLTTVLRGNRHDYIIALHFPEQNFAELLPVFQAVVDSFSEISPAGTQPDAQPQ